MLKKTPVVRGKPVVMRTRDDEEQLLMDWLNLQTTYSDSIRYLIQKEIAENGLRNLQGFIPQSRTIESLRNQLVAMPVALPTVHSAPEQQVNPLSKSPETECIDQSNVISEKALLNQTIYSSGSHGSTLEQANTHSQGRPIKRQAGKKFGSEVASSFAN